MSTLTNLSAVEFSITAHNRAEPHVSNIKGLDDKTAQKRASTVQVGRGFISDLPGWNGESIRIGTSGPIALSLSAIDFEINRDGFSGGLCSIAFPVIPTKESPTAVERMVGGVRISAEWSKAEKWAAPREGTAARAAAFAAGLALAGMDKTEAAVLAEAEGIVSHLTLIVLVDEEGAAVEGVPSTRKVPLANPATAAAPVISVSASSRWMADASCHDVPAVLAAPPMGQHMRFLKMRQDHLAISSGSPVDGNGDTGTAAIIALQAQRGLQELRVAVNWQRVDDIAVAEWVLLIEGYDEAAIARCEANLLAGGAQDVQSSLYLIDHLIQRSDLPGG